MKKRGRNTDDKRDQLHRPRDTSFLRVFLTDPVVKRALSRIKQKNSEVGDVLTRIEADIRSSDYCEPETSEADVSFLEEVFGKPTEQEKMEQEAKVKKMLGEFRIAEGQFSAEWQRKTGETPPQWKTDEELEQAIAWWREKAALSGIDTNTILAAEDHEVLAWEPVIKGRLSLLRLQAATLAGQIVSDLTPMQPREDDWGQSRPDDKWELEKLADDMHAWWDACAGFEPVDRDCADEDLAFENARQSMVLRARLIDLDQRRNKIVTALKLHGHISVAMDLANHFDVFFRSAHSFLSICTRGRQDDADCRQDVDSSRVDMEITRDFFWLVKQQLDQAGLVPRSKLEMPDGAVGETQGKDHSEPVERPSVGGWSKPHGLKEWSKVFGMSVTTMRRWFKTGNVTNTQMSQRRWKVAIEDLPHGYEQNPDFVEPPSGSRDKA